VYPILHQDVRYDIPVVGHELGVQIYEKAALPVRACASRSVNGRLYITLVSAAYGRDAAEYYWDIAGN